MTPEARQEWARQLVVGHRARSAPKVPHLAARPGWQRMAGPVVIEFILNCGPGIAGHRGMHATGRRFRA